MICSMAYIILVKRASLKISLIKGRCYMGNGSIPAAAGLISSLLVRPPRLLRCSRNAYGDFALRDTSQMPHGC